MNPKRFLDLFIPSLFAAVSICAVAAPGKVPLQSQQPQTGEEKSRKAPAPNRLRIEVTGGEKNQPVDNASVYIKFVHERMLRKDKKFEMNVKTNQDGVAHVPDPPKGKVLIQVVAEGWKPFGRWYDVEDPSQPIQIHLEKPQRWY